MVPFEDWWYKYQYEDQMYSYGPDADAKAAYIAGFNACINIWGGPTYEQTIEDEKQ
jgi:hypothetical protein